MKKYTLLALAILLLAICSAVSVSAACKKSLELCRLYEESLPGDSGGGDGSGGGGGGSSLPYYAYQEGYGGTFIQSGNTISVSLASGYSVSVKPAAGSKATISGPHGFVNYAPYFYVTPISQPCYIVVSFSKNGESHFGNPYF